MLALLGDEAVVVVPLVLPARRRERCVGLRARDQALEERPLAEHPAGAVVGRDQRLPDAEPAQPVGRLEAAGAGPDDDRLVVAGRRDPAHSAQRFAPRSLTATASSIRSAIVG